MCEETSSETTYYAESLCGSALYILYTYPRGGGKNQMDRTLRVPDIFVYNWTPDRKWGNFSRVRRKLFSYVDTRHVRITSSHYIVD